MCPSPFSTDIPMADEHNAVLAASETEGEELLDAPSIEQLLADGKRHLVCDDYSLAVSCFADACERLEMTYGDQAIELAEPLYYYGKSLLELARTETGVLGDKVPGDKDDEVSDSDSDSQADEQEAEKETVEKTEKNKAEPADEGKDPNVNTSEAGDNSNTNSEITDSKASTSESATISTDESAKMARDPSEEEDVGDVVEEEDEGEPSTLQLAWENLEVSKSIYAKLCQEKPECQPRLADVHMALSMLEIEEERFDQALEDCLVCLRIQKECLSEHDRSIAETHYQLAMIYQLSNARQEGLNHLNSSKQVLNNKLKQLENSTDNADPQIVKEIEDLKLLIPDIDAKINDAIVEMKDAVLYEQQIKAQLAQSSSVQVGFTSSASTSKTPAAPIDTRKVNDISGLIRKRKSDQPADENPEKKAKKSGE